MKISKNDMDRIYDIVTKLNNGVGTLKEYTPLMMFQNEGDAEKVKAGLDILTKKVDGIRNCKSNKELKKFIKIKKIITEEE